MLTRDQIMAAPLPALAALDVPEWGGAVSLRTLSLHEALAFSAEQDPARRAVMIIRLCVCSPDGVALFAEADDAWLATRPAAEIQRVALAAMEHNGLTRAAEEATAGN